MKRQSNNPAQFTDVLLTHLGELLSAEHQPLLVLDPFAGAGNLARLPYRFVGVEIEREWATSVQGDALHLPFRNNTFDAVATSPTYGNRMADGLCQDGRARITYRYRLGRPLTPGNSGAMPWGKAYCKLHQAAWREAWRVLKPGAAMLVNCKDHIRNKKPMPVTAWHIQALQEVGFTIEAVDEIPTPGMRYGQNWESRLPFESIIRGRKT